MDSTLSLPTACVFNSFSTTCVYPMSRLSYEHDVRPSVRPSVCLSVCLSVTLVDYDHTLQLKVEIDTTG